MAVVVAWRAFPQATMLAMLAAALLLQAGAVSSSAIPGVSHLATAKASADRWADRQTELASCRYRALAALGSADLAVLESVQRDCARILSE